MTPATRVLARGISLRVINLLVTNRGASWPGRWPVAARADEACMLGRTLTIGPWPGSKEAEILEAWEAALEGVI